MNPRIGQIINEINKAKPVQMGQNNTWLEKIPSQSGCYLIRTNASVAVLRKVGPHKCAAHTDIPETIRKAISLGDIAITQSANEPYVVYSGEAKNLRARAREHTKGHEKTYCLGLTDYNNLLNDYNWTFHFVTVPCESKSEGSNKLLRLAVEQAWRAVNGWPILCKK